jgi:septum site-determining protein MinC
MAAGNIHVYGVLRGRALAGNQGDTNARIFCQCLEADLVSIAGQYMVNEDFPAELCADPVQIHLQEKQLLIAALPNLHSQRDGHDQQ